MTEQELNEKLVRWVCPKARISRGEFGSEFIPSGKPFRTHQIDAKPVPHYTRSLDDCFRDLIPRVDIEATRDLDIQFTHREDKPDNVWQVVISSGGINMGVGEGSPSLGLCVAINNFLSNLVKL